MFIGIYERKILKIIYQYWKEPAEIALLLNKKSNVDKDINGYEIHERFAKNEFNFDSLDLLCISLNLKKLKGKDSKDKIIDAKFKRAVFRLFSGEYIKESHNQIYITDKGILAATDKYWFLTIIRENKSWLLALIISIIALIISIVSLVLKCK